jgi:hypothetical protein
MRNRRKKEDHTSTLAMLTSSTVAGLGPSLHRLAEKPSEKKSSGEAIIIFLMPCRQLRPTPLYLIKKVIIINETIREVRKLAYNQETWGRRKEIPPFSFFIYFSSFFTPLVGAFGTIKLLPSRVTAIICRSLVLLSCIHNSFIICKPVIENATT